MEKTVEHAETLNVFQKIALFVQQITQEMKRVVYPTRKETTTYVIVVLVFVTVIMLFITGVDFVIGELTTWIFA